MKKQNGHLSWADIPVLMPNFLKVLKKMTFFGDRAFQEVIRLNEVTTLGPNVIERD